MTFTLRSQAFCFFIHIAIICHEISQFSVCPQQVVLCEGISIACDALLSTKYELPYQKTYLQIFVPSEDSDLACFWIAKDAVSACGQ